MKEAGTPKLYKFHKQTLTSAHMARRNESDMRCQTSTASTSAAKEEEEEKSSILPACFQLRKKLNIETAAKAALKRRLNRSLALGEVTIQGISPMAVAGW